MLDVSVIAHGKTGVLIPKPGGRGGGGLGRKARCRQRRLTAPNPSSVGLRPTPSPARTRKGRTRAPLLLAEDRQQRSRLGRGDVAGAERRGGDGSGLVKLEERAEGVGADNRAPGGKRDAGGPLRLLGDWRDEADERPVAIEHGAAAGAFLHRGKNDRPRLVAAKRSRARRDPPPGETQDDQIGRERAQTRSLAFRSEIAGDDGETGGRVRTLEADGFAANAGAPAVVSLERRQRLARRDDERRRGQYSAGRRLRA